MTRTEICRNAVIARWKKFNESFPERFWARVDKNTGTDCWHWTGHIGERGYGEVKWAGRKMVASRAAYELVNGPVPKGHYVCHKCDNPKCVRPDHLFVGTQAQNIQDCVNKKRWKACRLCADDVKAIRWMGYVVPSKEIARLFGVAPNTISAILTGVSWKWLH